MAAVAAGLAASEALPLIQKGLEIANTEIVGYHKTTFKYDSKGLLKETHTWNASLKAWEVAALVLVGAAWEMGVIVSDAVKGTEEVAKMMFDPISSWVTQGLTLLGQGKPTGAPPSLSAGQALNAQLALAIHAVGQIVDPLLMPGSEKIAKKVMENVSKTS